MAAAQPAAAGHLGAERTAHMVPRPGRREAGGPPERGNTRRSATKRLAATTASGGAVWDGYRVSGTAYAFHCTVRCEGEPPRLARTPARRASLASAFFHAPRARAPRSAGSQARGRAP
eukprot:5836199-Alexandrium_andersonii.AAC.1